MPTKPTTKTRAPKQRPVTTARPRPPQPEGPPAQRPMLAELYHRAEKRLREQPVTSPPATEPVMSIVDSQKLLHELQVHQVELEMQNAELKEARDRMESSLEQYADLYDFAPVGYFTLDAESTILRVNLTGASLVGIERARLAGQRFDRLLAAELRPRFQALLKAAFADPTKQSGDFEFVNGSPPSRVFNLEGQCSGKGRGCRVVIADITARKQAEVAAAQLAAIVQSSSDAIIGKDLNGLVTSWNAGAEKLFGYRASEMVGQPGSRLIPTDRRQEEALILGRIRMGEVVEHFETVRVTRDGRLLDISATVSPIRSAAGRIVGASKVARDITEQKRAAETVRRSEIRYRRLFEAAHDGVLLLDPGTRKITDANPFMSKLLGYSNAQLIGKELFEIGLLKDEAASQRMFRKLKQQHEVRYEDLPLESQGGRHQEVEVVANLYQENGHPVIQCNIRDITERKLAEEALRRNEALFSALIDQAPYGVYVVDANLCLQQINRLALPVFGGIRPLLGRDASEILHILWPKPVADDIVARFRQTLATGTPYRSTDFAARRRDTRVQERYEWQLQRVMLPAGQPAVVCFFSEISERKRAEAARRNVAVLTASNRKLEKEIVRRRAVEASLTKSQQHQRQLLEQSRQLQAQLRGLSHQILLAQEEERKRISRELHDDVTQTLVSINVQLESLTKAAEISAALLRRKILRARRLVEKSVNIVHEFARELRPPALDHLGLISALHSFMKDFMKRTGIRVRFTTFAEVEKLNSTRCTVLYRVIQSALTNIAQHAHASRAEVTLQKRHRHVSLTVQDDGRSFDVARALSGNKSRRLGLIGMRERVEMVGGKFGITSAPGKGTTITAEIPFASGHGEPGGGGGRTNGAGTGTDRRLGSVPKPAARPAAT